ncbi:hypothetical protein V8D89_007898 [Ganoderma adspersum]
MATNGSTPAIGPPGALPFPHIPIENTLGAWLISVASSFLLNGLLFHQTYRYFREYGDDQKFLKVWVIIVVILQTFLSVLVLHTTWFYLVQMYWEPTYFFIRKTVWSLNLLPTAASATALCSQTFFIRRLWLLAPKFKIIATVIFLLNVANMACFTALSVEMFGSVNVIDALKFSWLASVAAAVQMAGDIVLTLALTYVFRKSRTGIGKTDSMLEVMIAYAIGTGAVNCVGHVLTVAFSIAYPHNFIYALCSCIDAKLYAIGFLVALDSRKFLAMTRFSTAASGPAGLSNWNTESSGHRSGMPISHVTSTPTAIELKVAVTEEIVTDDDDKLRPKWQGPTRSIA